MRSLASITLKEKIEIFKTLDMLLKQLGIPPIEAKQYDNISNVSIFVGNDMVSFTMDIGFGGSYVNDMKIIELFGEDN